jgi:integrase
VMFIGPNLEAVLAKLPNDGPLFPRLRQFGENIRASNFTKVCRRAGVVGVSLHCYRYSWSERAKRAGMPEREAMQQLGHNSRAVHRFYARKAGMITFPIEHYEAIRKGKIIQMDSEESPFKYPLVSRPAES